MSFITKVVSLTGTPEVIIPSSREGYDYVEFLNNGFGISMHVGTHLNAGVLSEYLTVGSGQTIKFDTDAIKNATFWGTGDDDLQITYGRKRSSGPKNADFKIRFLNAIASPATRDDYVLAPARVEGYSYFYLKVIGANNVDVAFKLPNGAMPATEKVNLSQGESLLYDTESLGQVGIYMQAVSGNSLIEAAYG